MTALITEKFFLNNLTNFVNDIQSTGDAYYFFVGRSVPWSNGDSNTVTAVNDYDEFELSIYHDIVLGKQITNNNISYLVPNYSWANNSFYAQYDPNDPDLFSEIFYVVNQNNAVYKCIDNNLGINSTSQPLITPTTGTFQTADGYTWKFMFSIPSSQNTIFTTNNYIPVVPNTSVSNNAVDGTIDIVRVLNGGSNWQGYNTGYIQNLIDQNTVQIINGINIDNYYTGSSIYLAAGLGPAQINKITSYSGSTQTLTVSPAFNTYINLFLNQSYTGNFSIGQSVQQTITELNYIFPQGFLNVGDVVYQPYTNGHGTIISMNTTSMSVVQTSPSPANDFYLSYPVLDLSYAQVAQTGTVSTFKGSNVISSGGANGTANLLNFSVGEYIRIGSSQNTNIRMISTILNANQATLNIPLTSANLVANVIYSVPSAFSPVTNNISSANGIIIQTNLNSMIVNYGNLSSNTISFIVGETVKEYNGSDIDQHSNGIVSFVNTSTLILSSVQGTLTSGLFLVGQSSTLEAQITSIVAYPSISLSNTNGNFISGDPINSYYANGTLGGNATVQTSSASPSITTQYIISPTVNFEGDGEGAQAIAIVNTSVGNNFSISSIQMINNGNNYTVANIYLTANSLYGSGANLYPVISPVEGHGANAYMELGARFLGVSMTIDTIANESYYFPGYGSYRRVGIIKNPLYNQLTINTDNVHRYSFNIQVVNANNFVNGEIIYQYSNSAAAKIISANSTILLVDTINGIFTTNAVSNSVNNLIIGLTSGSLANVISSNAFQFQVTSNSQIITNESNSTANGILQEVITNNQIILTDVSGKFVANTLIFDASINAYANALSLFVANGTINATSTFGQRFLQTFRITLSSNSSIPFQIGEYITQANTNASGLVIDNINEKDFIYTPNHGTFGAGLSLTDANSAATGVITFANSTYIRITSANGTFNSGDIISTISANGNITSVLPVLVLGDVYPSNPFVEGTFILVGNTSGAQGLNGISNTILYPDLVRNTGDVLYINDLDPFTLGANTKTTFNMVFQI